MIDPHGGALVSLVADEPRAEALRVASREWPSWNLTRPQLDDLELLATGAFSPLRTFLGADDLAAVVERSQLADGTLWPSPAALVVDDETVEEPGVPLALRDLEGVLLAVLHGPERFRLPAELSGAQETGGQVAVTGRLEVLALPTRYDYRELRLTPGQTRTKLRERGFQRVVAYQASGPADERVYEEAIEAARELRAGLLVQIATGPAPPDDPEHHERVRGHRDALARHPPDAVALMLLPLRSEPDPDRDALLRAIVARNHGCSHVLVDPGAVPILARHEPELGVTPLAATRPAPSTPREARGEDRQGSQPARNGVTVLFTGLSGSGKSTIANVLLVKLLERGDRTASLLDGDLVRRHLSSELGFSREDRDLNVRRIGYVASEITKHGGIAICAPIAPYDETRREVRRMVEAVGGFVLVHVATPLEVCEQRDRKGLYAKARAGELPGFTGVSDPYEAPTDADLRVDTTEVSAEEAADQVIALLRRKGHLI